LGFKGKIFNVLIAKQFQRNRCKMSIVNKGYSASCERREDSEEKAT